MNTGLAQMKITNQTTYMELWLNVGASGYTQFDGSLLATTDGVGSIGALGAGFSRPATIYATSLISCLSNVTAGGAMGAGVQYSTSSANEVINNNTGYYILDPGSVIAAKTITMPAVPIDSQEVTIAGGNTSGGVTVTALTVSPNAGQTINGAPTTLAANGHYKWRYYLADTTWYLVG